MKKLLLAAAVATFATSALASENMFYVKAEAGASYLPTQKLKYSDGNTKFKSSNAMNAGFGVGTYLMDNVRAELVLSGTFNASQKAKEDKDNKKKYNVMSAHVKGLVDVVDLGYASIFAGAGVGVSNAKIKLEKKVTNFSYLGTVGASMEATDGVKVELAYTYADHGKSKKDKDNKKAPRFHFASHNVTAGLRVEL